MAPRHDDDAAHPEWRRRAFHVAGGVFPLAYLLDVVSWGQLRWIYLAGTALAVGLEANRLLVGADWRIYRELTRAYERTNPAGYALYVVGSAVAVLAFPPRIGVPAVLMLAIADPLSGVLARNDPSGSKRPGVLAVTFVVCLGLALPFVRPVAAVAGAAVATLADGVTPVIAGYVIDDNVAIPVGAALGMWAASGLLP